MYNVWAFQFAFFVFVYIIYFCFGSCCGDSYAIWEALNQGKKFSNKCILSFVGRISRLINGFCKVSATDSVHVIAEVVVETVAYSRIGLKYNK